MTKETGVTLNLDIRRAVVELDSQIEKHTL